MGTLEPECQELMEFYTHRMIEHVRIADACSIPRFSAALRRDLLKIFGDQKSVSLIESAVRLGDFANIKDISAMRRAVSRQLKKRGVPGRRGKRTSPGLLEFVERTTPILLRLGVPLATSERSLLVRALRAISWELELPGDPRDELRRLTKLKADHEKAVRKILLRAIQDALTPDKYIPP